MPAPNPGLVQPRTIDIGTVLSCYQHGGQDPTTRLQTDGGGTTARGKFVRATLTPDGPGTVRMTWGTTVGQYDNQITIEGVTFSINSYGPGGNWLAAQLPSMLGVDDVADHGLEAADHEVVADAAGRHRSLRVGASGDFFHELLPTILEQRITAGEAHRQWLMLCNEFGAPAPGPIDGLRLPPAPNLLSRIPSWQLHPLGIERKRADALSAVARHPAKLWKWALLPPTEAAAKLRLIPGVGEWTIGSVVGPVLGDADAVAVGDFHLKNMVSWALAGEPRGTDERMLELLEPYRPQRGRVVRLLILAGLAAPKFGPKQRILPMYSW